MKKIIREWVIPLGTAAVLALIIHTFVFFLIHIPSPSMVPTINVGDRMLVTKVYNPKNLKRGDIVVFDFKETDQQFIKRLIGLPSDKVEIKNDGTVYINGEKLDESYVKNPGGPSGTTYEVPADSYFFLGDNRSDSKDSRYWSNPYISAEDIIGKAQFTIYPFNKFGRVK
ncbi:MAG: signal peptidase I [Clostridiaceae bacterium]